MAPLLNSDVFCHQFECDDWPLIHTDNQYMMEPFNGSIFQLNSHYKEVFHSLYLQDEENQGEDKEQKYYKIKYTLNLLPATTYNKEGESVYMNELMDILGETEDGEIFRTKVLQDFFDFMWNRFAKHLLYFGALIHMVYVIVFAIYTNQVFVHRYHENRTWMTWAMLLCLIYPMVYDFL